MPRLLGACSSDAPGGMTGGVSMTTTTPAANGGSSASPTAGARAMAANGGSSARVSPPSTAAISGGSGGSSTTVIAGSPATAGTSAASSGSSATASSAGSGGAGGSAAAGGGAISMVTGWATGGTKAMQGNYPDPFMGSTMASSCTLYPTQTIGPCYAMGPMMREDISDGLDGLPIRLSFLVVHTSGCVPVPGASIDIWHSGSDGIYSAYDTGTTCNPGTTNVKSMMFCRGVQTTDETGRANFSTVFPGWYRGRTIHVHFTVRISGKEYVTSQLYFDDKLTDEILAQGTYQARGKRDTNNSSDMLFTSGGAKPDQVLFDTAKRADGALHAWKVLSIT
jgi:protocatechuate 3,4-dioxygenase beta subunit